MKTNRLLLGLALLVAGALPTLAQVSNDNEDGVNKVDEHARRNDFVPGQVLVKFKDESSVNVNKARGMFRSAGNNSVDAVLKEFSVKKMDKLLPNAKSQEHSNKSRSSNRDLVEEKDLSQLYLVETDETHAPQTMQLVEKLNELDEVEYAEPNYKVYLADANIAANFGGNPYTTQQWYLDSYGVKQLWNKPILNPKRPVIAILDTGVDMTHPDLAPNLWTNTAEAEGEANYDNDGNGFKGDVHGWDFINNTPNISDFNMHGTHVAGIAAAANNGIGIIGANPMALIMPISVMQSDGTGDVATIVKGIDYAVQMGADVLNLSLGTYANSRAMRQALERAYQSAVIVAAAGNDGKCINSPHHPSPCYGAAPMFPAAYSFVLGVQATTYGGGLAGFSNYDDDGKTFSSVTTLQDPDGFNYELKAPGTDMLSTVPGGKYKVLNGTSIAAPLVAGSVSALMMVKNYDSQEILWGDLLHTNNIAGAYAVTARPAELGLMKIMYRERKELSDVTEKDISNVGEVDAGETVSLYPVMRTTFGAASNIKMYLEMGDEFEDPNTVQIITDKNNKVDFGLHLDAYGKGTSLNPLIVKIADKVADGRHIKMKFVATCDESNVTYFKTFTLVVTNMVKISGLISEDRTLTADHVYLVNDNVGIMEGSTLTIEPGTRLEFMDGIKLSSWGKLVANGTPEKPIIFTGYHDAIWPGISTHQSTGISEESNGEYLYTNADSTLFTLKRTPQTPKRIYYRFTNSFYQKEGESVKRFNLSAYMNINEEMTAHQNLLTDPNYLTPAILQLLSDWREYCSQFPTTATDEFVEYNSSDVDLWYPWRTYENPRDTISYCRLESVGDAEYTYFPYMNDCIIMLSGNNKYFTSSYLCGLRNVLMGGDGISLRDISPDFKDGTIIHNYCEFKKTDLYVPLPLYSKLNNLNYINNFAYYQSNKKYYALAINSGPVIDVSSTPSYLGTSREDLVRPYIYEIGNAPDTYGQIDLSNMRTTPVAEAHGIVWKVCVNGKDAQDEYEDLAPLGVGKHKFEVYFNRPMNKEVAPQITFGVRDPWTQNVVSEDGSWNEEGTIYTAYKTITGKTKSDGVNRIYVYGAEDNEFFECPYEKTRFNMMINAAGSMATGFAGEAKMGRVELTWNNDNNDFEDAMGFNIYRFNPDEKRTIPAHYDEDWNWIEETEVVDTICINKEIVDVETTEYTDYDVIPGQTYYYMYKVLSTDLKEYDVSNVVAVTPLTSERGDANGSGDVDVADVITTVNYAAGMKPVPFIFEAADMNTDLQIDILDVIGIIQKILNPGAQSLGLMSEAIATYTVEDGVLYVESPVALGGVQVQLNMLEKKDINVANDLDGFEHTSAWLTDNDYIFLAYNMNGKTLSAGKHALLNIGNADISSIRLSNAIGHNVNIEKNGTNPTGVQAIGAKVFLQGGVFNMNGQKVTGKDADLKKLPKGVYIINGEKVVK